MLVEPARAAGRRRHHAERLVVDALDLLGLAVLPRRHAVPLRPGVGVAVALQADQHGGRGVGVRLGIAADLVLADPQIEGVAGHERLDAAPADRAAVVERQVAIDDVGHEIGAPHGEAAHRIGLDVVLVLVEVVGAREPVLELVGRVEDEIGVVDEVHQVRRRRAGDQHGGRGTGIDDAVHGVDRDREQRALLPFEDVLLAVAFEPDLGRAAALGDQVDFLVEVLFRIERAGARHLDDVAAPFALGAVELDVGALAAQALPGLHRQVEHGLDADVAEDRDAVRLHEQVVGRLRTAEFADAGAVDAGRFVPVGVFSPTSCIARSFSLRVALESEGIATFYRPAHRISQ